ncbi:hypothetical protein QN362_04650 [Actimicrobium sp. CCC2.4]|uniref:hypothetical protein n=1 Tax=Actimicrobium sp. CCC2.4 TaxID=3048606 RepID=UPI002AC97F5E|nr:hypothetical protein [Actimicrobium sp. CCC2.4]MEB0134617.1 hypothetical protein [Actimicrobium sp. CCC2.4]WPX30559.1 hypothetical protein RHM62_09730 [Actimicrobium sp. CCC2.4]
MSSTIQYSLQESNDLTSRQFVLKLLEIAIKRVNAGVSKTLTARKTSERPPRDPRHLTDTRTRVSTLLEYSVAYEMNNILHQDNSGLSVAAVLWNVFPDLIIRNRQRDNEIGLEVKALHTAAEEKSANLATPLQLIRYRKDFIVIINWGWQVGVHEGTSITYPHIHLVGVFDAWLLAKIRDYGWLLNQGGRVKGIDVATPIINGAEATYKAEEGNMGKLMRIQLPQEMPQSVPHYLEMREEDDLYTKFKQQVLALGLRETFLDICLLEGCIQADAEVGTEYPQECKILGNVELPSGVNFQLLAGPRPDQWLRTIGVRSSPSKTALLWLGVKLDWKLFAIRGGYWTIMDQGKKPDSEYDRIQANLRAAHWLEEVAET